MSEQDYSIPQFVANQVEITSFGGLPVSDDNGHIVIIYNGRKKPTKNDEKSGILELNLRIVTGPFQGQEGSVNLNLWNQSEKAAKIAVEEFARILWSINMETVPVNDIRALFNKPFKVLVRKQALNQEDIAAGRTESRYTEVYGYMNHEGKKRWELKDEVQQAPTQGGFGGQPVQAQVQAQPTQVQQTPPTQQWGAPAQSQQAPPVQQQTAAIQTAPPSGQSPWGAQGQASGAAKPAWGA